ncbi:MAG TPA: PepSY-associated TM helix domain-containing protein [Burkholderiaceae bacterium]|nr:PepSY-associated TM helix domain-containing protein [Burkholderiaceae bacterium]
MKARAAQSMNRGAWLRLLLKWHWMSSAVCLVGLLLFAITGMTLNHAAQIEAKPVTESRKAELPPALRAELAAHTGSRRDGLPAPLRDWLQRELRLDVPAGASAEWSGDELYVPLPRAGGDAWLRIGLADGALEYERTDRGWIALLNDLHKGRHTGLAWTVFIDVFAAACLLFALTGLLVLKLHAVNRPVTWPLVGAGLVLPLVLAVLFVH